MNVDELLNAERPLTNEELEFLEQQALSLARELEHIMQELSEQVEEKDPELAAEVRRPARKMVQALEQAAAIPFEEPRSLTRLPEFVPKGDRRRALDSLEEEA